ncbi:MAG: hypothetical protein ACI9IP_001215 [Arcticibacterium sp.]|jgi:hypothetical protein
MGRPLTIFTGHIVTNKELSIYFISNKTGIELISHSFGAHNIGIDVMTSLKPKLVYVKSKMILLSEATSSLILSKVHYSTKLKSWL